MTKKLKIRFVKFEHALVMQILEQEGKFVDTEHVKIDGSPRLYLGEVFLRGRYTNNNLTPDFCSFSSNAERDEYLNNVVKWITDEQFTNTDNNELKIGSNCEMRDHETEIWLQGKLVAILPEQYFNRYACEYKCGNKNLAYNYRYARPIQHIEPKIDGDVYTWEM